MLEGPFRGRTWRSFRRGVIALGLLIGSGGGIGCHGPAAKKPAPETPGIGSLFGPSIADLINQKPATELPPPPEPKIINQADDKATLIFTPRHVQTDVLKDAISGMLNPDGTVQNSVALNALIVQDRKDVINNILTVMQTLDIATPQLLVEARIVEVTLTDDLEYEISHLLSIPSSPLAMLKNSSVTLKVPGASPTIGSGGQGLEFNFRPWASSSVKLDDVIRLLETRGKANILSNPNVIVAPGTPASIITGSELPIQNSTTVGGSVSTNTVFKSVGIKLRVNLLQITRDTARIEISPEVSTVTGSVTSGGVSNPIISLRSVSSTLSLKDGEILTIGGLLQDNSNLNTRGIPGLQDIPKAGFLFQSKRDEKTKTQLIFFLRVHILPEGVPGDVRVHNPGEGMDNIGKDAKELNPNSKGEPPPTPPKSLQGDAAPAGSTP